MFRYFVMHVRWLWYAKGILLSAVMVAIGSMHVVHGGFYFPEGTFDPFLTADSVTPLEQPTGSPTDEVVGTGIDKDIADLFEMILKVLYMLLRPLLAVAGASLDNSLVYGEIFYLDKALWQFWQMMRTFANFALGFIFLTSIFVSFVGAGKKFEKISVKTIIKKLFLAGILVNMSWFMVAALLDLSTVLVFSVGAMPLNVVREDVQNDQGAGRARILSSHSLYNQDMSANVNRDQLEHSVIYSCPGTAVDVGPNLPDATEFQYYLPCRVEGGILAPRGAVDENNTWDNRKQLYIDAWKVKEDITSQISDNYCVWGNDLVENMHGTSFTEREIPTARLRGYTEMEGRNCSTLDTLMEKAQGMTGPLYTLYSTILRMGEIGVTINNKTTTEKSLEFLMKVVVGLALFLPLVALAVVLVMRAVIMWLIIAFSPLMVLVYVFGFKAIGGDKGELKNVLGLIFLPVIAVFAVSISILFLTLVGRYERITENLAPQGPENCPDDAFSRLTGAEKTCPNDTDTCYKIFNITDICFTASQRNIGSNIVNILTWLTVNFFGIALMRMIIFAALKSNAITKGVVSSIEKFGKGLAMTATVVPMPGGMTSFGALGKSMENLKGMPDKIVSQQYNKGLAEHIEARGARPNANKKQTELSAKLDEAKNGRAVSFAASDFELPDDTNHTQYPSLGPALGMASGKEYNEAKRMSFADAYSDTSTIGYMQGNDLYNTNTWVKNGQGLGVQKKAELARSMEEKMKTKARTLGADTANVHATWYVLGDYVTKFPWASASRDELAQDITNYKVAATPTTKTDWDGFKTFLKDQAGGVRGNADFATTFSTYLNAINIGSWTDASNPSAPKTYSITAVRTGTGPIESFEMTEMP